MNTLNKIITAAALSFGLTSTAQATFLTGTYITTDDPYKFNLQVEQKANTSIESAKLWMYFSDPSDYFKKQNEVLTVKFDNTYIGTISSVSAGGQYYGINVLPSYLLDGNLAVSLSLGCNRVSAYSCTDQNVWLNDIFLAISRVPTKPTTPAAPAPVTPPPTPAPTTPQVPAPVTPAAPDATLPVPPVAVEPAKPVTPAEPTTPNVALPLPPVAIEPVIPGAPADSAIIPGKSSEVPEPATLLTLALGLLGLAAARRRT